MSRIRELIRDDGVQALSGVNSIENSLLYTTDRLLIVSNKAVLPSIAIGSLVWNMAIIFTDLITNIIVSEVTATTDSVHVLFDQNDNLNGMYCVVSYLTFKEPV